VLRQPGAAITTRVPAIKMRSPQVNENAPKGSTVIVLLPRSNTTDPESTGAS